jgi:sortase A
MRARVSWNQRRSRGHGRLLAIEYFFLLLGLIALDCYIWVNTSSTLYQAYQDWAFDQKLRGLTPSIGGFVGEELSWFKGREIPSQAGPESNQPLTPLPGEKPPAHSMVLGRLEIPRLRVKAMVREGADESTLRRAVGHIPGTALPGGIGNVALAGHRDTFFRGLRNIQKNDKIDLETEDGTYRYVVQSTKIVGPRDVSVLAASSGETLTLVTCYPFYYIGSAPKRFIVRATQVAANHLPQPQRGS